MSVIIRLQNLSWDASAADMRRFFAGMSIPDGGVHIIGGEKGDAFIAFSTDEDARQAMMLSGQIMCGEKIILMLSSKNEMNQVIAIARGEDPAKVSVAQANVASTSPLVTSQAQTPAYPMMGTPSQLPMNAFSQFANLSQLNLSQLLPNAALATSQLKQSGALFAAFQPQDGSAVYTATDPTVFMDTSKTTQPAHNEKLTIQPQRYPSGNRNTMSRDPRTRLNNAAAETNRFDQKAMESNNEKPSYPPATDTIPRDRWHEGPPQIQVPPRMPGLAKGPRPPFSERPSLLGSGPRPTLHENARTRDPRNPPVERPMRQSRFHDGDATMDTSRYTEQPMDPKFQTQGQNSNHGGRDPRFRGTFSPAENTFREKPHLRDPRFREQPPFHEPQKSPNDQVPSDRQQTKSLLNERPQVGHNRPQLLGDRHPPIGNNSRAPLLGVTPRDTGRSRWSDSSDVKRDNEKGTDGHEKNKVDPRRSSIDAQTERDRTERKDHSDKSRDRDRDRDRDRSRDHDRDRSNRRESSTRDKHDSRDRERREGRTLSDDGSRKERTRDRDRRDRDKSSSNRPEREKRSFSRRGSSDQEKGRNSEHGRDRPDKNEKSSESNQTYRDKDVNGNKDKEVTANKSSSAGGLLPHPLATDKSSSPVQMHPSSEHVDLGIKPGNGSHAASLVDDSRQKRSRDSGCCVFISSMPFTVSYRDVRRFFSNAEILREGLKLINDPSGIRNGTAYVRFISVHALHIGLEKNGKYLFDQQVSVVRCSEDEFEDAIDSYDPKMLRTMSPMREPIMPKDMCVCINGLPLSVDIVDINTLFQGLNFITNSVYIEYDLDGKALGSAYLEFSTPLDFKAALENPHPEIGNCAVVIHPMSRKGIENRVKFHKDYLEKRKIEAGAVDVPENGMDIRMSHNPMLPPAEMLPPGRPEGFCCHVFGLSYSSTEMDIADFFVGLNILPDGIKIVRYPNGRAAGDCVVEFSSPKDQEEAITRTERYMGQRYLFVHKINSRAEAIRLYHTKCSIAEHKLGMPPVPMRDPRGPRGPLLMPHDDMRIPLPPHLHDELRHPHPKPHDVMFSPTSTPPPGRPSCVVRISNIHFRCSPTEVLEFFRGYRPILESLRVRRNPETGKPAGDGSIAFHSPPDAIRAVVELNGQLLAGRSLSLIL